MWKKEGTICFWIIFLLLNRHSELSPVPLAVILPPQSLLPYLPGHRCSLRQLPSLKQSPSFYLWGKFKNRDMDGTYWRMSVGREHERKTYMQGKSRRGFAFSESCLPSLQNSASVPVPLHFLVLFVVVSSLPTTEHRQGDLSFCSQLCLTWLYFTEVYKSILATWAASIWKLKQKSVKAEDFPEKLCMILWGCSRLFILFSIDCRKH